MPKTMVRVKLASEDGNAYSIMVKVRAALRKEGHKNLIEEFTKEASSGDYDHLLQTVMKYVIVD